MLSNQSMKLGRKYQITKCLVTEVPSNIVPSNEEPSNKVPSNEEPSNYATDRCT